MSQIQSARPSDPLASLRIDRSARSRPRSGWFVKAVAVCLVLGLIGAGVAWAWQRYGETLTSPRVKVASVEARVPGDADSILSAQGYLKSEKQAAIGAKVAGRVLRVYVKEGQPVAKDALLAELEHGDIDESLQAMKASLEAQAASLEGMRASLEKAKAEVEEIESIAAQDVRDFARAEQLFRSRSIAASDFETAKSKHLASVSRRLSMAAAVLIAQSRLREAEARHRESQARYRETGQQRDYMFVRAPFQGVVISKEAEDGESIMPGGLGGASGRGSIVTLADLLNLEVDTDVKEDYIGRVKKGQRVSVAVAAVPNTRFGGVVRTIIPMGDRAKGTVKVKVQLDPNEVKRVNDPQTQTFTLFPEMAATVHFQSEGKTVSSGQVTAQLFVPAAAVQSDTGGEFVWQVEDDRVKRRPIDTGETRDGRVLITGGLSAGERVVVDPPAGLKEEMLVKIAQ
ncbi:MAG: efflux RND transporter periplasmic adaptor subunit [Gemmataceae bacterium]|nr:efflux RND transporter periplasmic adaptor subunit [Gemmataceae bacterium]